MNKILVQNSDNCYVMIQLRELEEIDLFEEDRKIVFYYNIIQNREVVFSSKELYDEAWKHIKETLIPSQLVHIPPDDRCKCSIPDINPHPKGGSYCGFCGGSLPTDLFSARG